MSRKPDSGSSRPSLALQSLFGNPIAKMSVSPNAKLITKLDLVSISLPDAGLRLTSQLGDGTEYSTREVYGHSQARKSALVDMIYKSIKSGKVDLSYAMVGHTSLGRAILDYDVLVKLLVEYGFQVEAVLCFIEELSSKSSGDDRFPIVMVSLQSSKIYQDVSPLASLETSCQAGKSKNKQKKERS